MDKKFFQKFATGACAACQCGMNTGQYKFGRDTYRKPFSILFTCGLKNLSVLHASLCPYIRQCTRLPKDHNMAVAASGFVILSEAKNLFAGVIKNSLPVLAGNFL
jgi:hypothetical protein